LGDGSDGDVTLYKHRHIDFCVAVKTQKDDSAHARLTILREIESLRTIGRHPHVASMLTECPDFQSWVTKGPAIFFQVADLGDVATYQWKWAVQQNERDMPQQLPEITLWKFFRDMALALDHIHNRLGTCYLHQDFKPQNILARTPPGHLGDGLPTEPIFQLTDFARLASYPPPRDQPASIEFAGTWMYAAPAAERVAPFLPSVDMYSLGATIQALALNYQPIESRKSFMRALRAAGLPCPKSERNCDNQVWRRHRRVVYRPLSATREELTVLWDVEDHEHVRHHRPYSTLLDLWYEQLLLSDPKKRIASVDLAKYLVPMIDMQLPVARIEFQVNSAFYKAESIR
ncbi:kinase-like protein, partial [Ophiobolus disseminans]